MITVTSMSVITHKRIQLFVDKRSRRWIARDEKGNFWALADANPWEERQQVIMNEEIHLEPVPGHYKHMLGIPG